MLSTATDTEKVDAIVSAIQQDDLELLKDTLNAIQWKPNTRWQTDFKESLPAAKKFTGLSYCCALNLLAIVVVVGKIKFVQWVFEQGETECLGSIFSYNKDCSLLYALLRNADESEGNETAFPLPLLIEAIPSFVSTHPPEQEVNDVIRYCVEHDLPEIIDGLRRYLNNFSIQRIEDWSVQGFVTDILTAEDFSLPALSKVATQWADHQLTASFTPDKIDYLDKFIRPVLAHYIDGEITLDNISKYIDVRECQPATAIVLYEEGAIPSLDAVLYGYKIRDASPAQMKTLFQYATTALKSADVITYLDRYKAHDDVLEELIKNQLTYGFIDYKMGINYIFLETFRYHAKAFMTLMRIANKLSPHFPVIAPYLDITMYWNRPIEVSTREEMRKLDWSLIIPLFNKPKLAALKIDTLPLKEQIRSVLDTAYQPLWPVLIQALIDEKGVEAIGTQMQHKEWVEAFLLLITPMEALPYLPKRAQTRVLTNLA